MGYRVGKPDQPIGEAGTFRLVNFLAKAPISAEERLRTVLSFPTGTIAFQTVTEDQFAYRWYNKANDEYAKQLGYFLSPDLILDRDAARRLLALPETNKMLELARIRIKAGAQIFTGGVAPLNGLPGGGNQILMSSDPAEYLVVDKILYP